MNKKKITLSLAVIVAASSSLALSGAALAQGVNTRKEMIHLALLDCYQKLGKGAETNQEFATLVAIKPNDAKLQYNYGYHLYTLGQTANAIARYRKACQLDPANQDYHGNLANLLMQVKDYNGAMAEYGRAGERFRPQFEQVQRYIQQLQQQKAYEASMKKPAGGKKPAAVAKPKNDDDDDE